MGSLFRKKLSKGFSRPGKGSFETPDRGVAASDSHPIGSTGVKKLTSKRRKPKLNFGS